jgi:hypothetical protein
LLWAYRNAAVHGKISGFTESKESKQLRMKVETAYSRFQSDPFYIIQSRRYLFSRPIESVTSLDRDSMTCWCKSVREAELTLKKAGRADEQAPKEYTTPLFQQSRF